MLPAKSRLGHLASDIAFDQLTLAGVRHEHPLPNFWPQEQHLEPAENDRHLVPNGQWPTLLHEHLFWFRQRVQHPLLHHYLILSPSPLTQTKRFHPKPKWFRAC